MNAPLPYHPPGEPVTNPLTLDTPSLAEQPLSGAVELAAERGPVVYVPGAHGGFVAVRREDLPTTPAPVPAPAPSGVDPHAQRTAAKGVFAAGAGVGAYFAAGAAAIVLDSLAQALIAAAVAAGVAIAAPGRRGGGGDTYVTHHHVSNRWFGRSHTTIRNH
ncbi:hypothetical protein IGW14_11255 [Streptomyces hygroscopicus subsp. hygroscopicus]|uniref:hypothetical protein n=1 Tax=Streptomyces hygroscopicus TaxID=1912 RepID=UPI001C65B278|nr:hypothetical protein [Streptomyces hygroscopicus]MBW8088591.1 hypothetical protein [Streptomyces hygroscopicus subsp. hygroscopicus]